jgi:uncharacterized protein YggE
VSAVAGVAVLVVGGCSTASREPQAQFLPAAPVGSTTSDTRTITGTGTGEVRGRPDTLTMSIGVESRAAGADAALRRSTAQTEKVLQVLTDAGVSKDDVQTSGLSISPEFDGDGEKITAYTSSNSLTVTTHDLDGAGRIIDAAAGAVGDDIRIDGVWFSIEDTGELVKQARADAVRKAGEQAQQLAGAAGIGLGPVVGIEETSDPVYPVAESDAGRAAAPAPIEPGTQDLSVTVTVVYRIA